MSKDKERFLFSFSFLGLVPGQEGSFEKIICNPAFITRSLPTIFQTLVQRLLADEIDLIYAFYEDLNYWQRFFHSCNIKINSDILDRIKLSPIEDFRYFVGDRFYTIQVKENASGDYDCFSALWVCSSNGR